MSEVKVLVKNNEARVIGIAPTQDGMPLIQLIPGANELSKEDWDKAKKHPQIKKKMEEKIVVPNKGSFYKLEVIFKPDETEEPAVGDGSSLAHLKGEDAKELVAETHNIELLRTWLKAEKRKGVTEALEAQIKAFEEDQQKRLDNDGSDE